MRYATYHPNLPTEARKIVTDFGNISQELGDEFWTELTDAINYATKFPEVHHFDASGRRRSNLKAVPIFIFSSEFSMIASALRLFATTAAVRSSEVAANKTEER